MKDLLVPIGVNLVLGVVLFVLLVWKRGPDTVRLTSEADALAEFQREFPEATGTATVSADGLAALVETATGAGLLARHGRRWNARLLLAHELAAVRAPDESTLELRFADFGWPRSRLRFSDPDAMIRCRTRLETLGYSGAPPATEVRHA